MDNDLQWAATGLFSPSKARQQEAQAKDWQYIDTWLQQRYAPRQVPTFERNEDTLQALLTLAATNESAEERQYLVTAVEKAALQDMRNHADADGDNVVIYEVLNQNLSSEGRVAVDAVADVAVMINSYDCRPESIAQRIMQLTTEKFEISQQLRRTDELRNYLGSEQRSMNKLLSELQSEALSAPQNLPQQTAEWTRGIKHLKTKLVEYNDRLNSTKTSPPEPSVATIKAQLLERQQLREHIEDLERRISAFRDLPPSTDGARAKLDEAKIALRDTLVRRDQLFERLFER